MLICWEEGWEEVPRTVTGVGADHARGGRLSETSEEINRARATLKATRVFLSPLWPWMVRKMSGHLVVIPWSHNVTGLSFFHIAKSREDPKQQHMHAASVDACSLAVMATLATCVQKYVGSGNRKSWHETEWTTNCNTSGNTRSVFSECTFRSGPAHRQNCVIEERHSDVIPSVEQPTSLRSISTRSTDLPIPLRNCFSISTSFARCGCPAQRPTLLYVCVEKTTPATAEKAVLRISHTSRRGLQRDDGPAQPPVLRGLSPRPPCAPR